MSNVTDITGLLIEDVADEFEKTGKITVPAGEKDTNPLRCEICGTALTYKGRGTKPRFCADHKGGKSRPDPEAPPPLSERKQTAKTKGLETHLIGYVEGLAWLVNIKNPVDARTISLQAPKVVHELCMLAETDRYWFRLLTFISQPGKYGPLTAAMVTLLFPIMLNHGMVSPMLFAPAPPPTEGR